jgi:hypothetical protein
LESGACALLVTVAVLFSLVLVAECLREKFYPKRRDDIDELSLKEWAERSRQKRDPESGQRT